VKKEWIHDPTANKDSIGAVVNLHTKHNLYDPENALTTGGSGRCSKCHMTKTATTAKAYDIHTHSFAVIPPGQTLKYQSVTTPTQGMMNTCAASCHRNGTGAIPTWGITDASLTNWAEGTDLALADTLWRYWQGWGWTGVKEVPNVVPIGYSLSQNFPNPFNPSTKIVVDLPRHEKATLVVYNIIGQVVATLMDGEFDAGRYEVVWTGRDDFGLQSPTGMYMYKLEAGKYSKTFKMLMVK
jgi:hypothetical protein